MNEVVSTSSGPSSSLTSTAVTTRDVDNIRILHLTDLHCGRGFQKDLWNHIEAIARELKPHVILVTGDLVNNPYWWTLQKALGLLTSLSAAATRTGDQGPSATETRSGDQKPSDAATSSGSQEPKVFVIPGNHDTRVLGLLPIAWIAPIATFFFVGVSFFGYFHYWPQAWVPAGIIALLLLAYRYLCLAEFANFFRKYIPSRPTTLKDLNLVLYPFDSATFSTSGAAGNIPLSQFVEASRANEHTEAAPYRIAIVHHHSVPIPYDSSSEGLMVLKNAGAFLSEIASCGVRLVLSGHKHHQHVSRVTINAETEKELELTVLNTGSATAGKYPGAFGHNFSVIEVYPQSGAQITQYRSDGGSFKPLKPFWVDSVENCGKALLRENKLLRGFHYDSLETNVVINADGDGFRTTKVHGFSYYGEGETDVLPIPWRNRVSTGQIERPRVRPDPGSPVETELVWSVRQRQDVEGKIKLSRPIRRGHDPLGFAIECHNINAYAMSAQQFSLLHPARKADPIEYVQIALRQVPVGDLTIGVTLPPNFKVDGKPELLILRGNSVEQRLQSAYAGQLNFDQLSNTISVRIPTPPIGLRYRVAWRLTDAPPPAGRRFQHLEGEAAMIVDRLVELAKHDRQANSLSTRLLAAIAQEARTEFGLMSETSDPLFLCIMVFDPKLNKLRVAAGNFKENDPRWNVELAYGDGIAGRAYKMNSARLFVKAKSKQNGIPFYYTDGTGDAPSDTGDEIMEEALISLPLSHPDEALATFGILNISSHRRDSRLVNLTDDRITTQFRHAVSKACFEAIKELP
jgi:3',5'-cyclic AMP phosphodiesterase CpdA